MSSKFPQEIVFTDIANNNTSLIFTPTARLLRENKHFFVIGRLFQNLLTGVLW